MRLALYALRAKGEMTVICTGAIKAKGATFTGRLFRARHKHRQVSKTHSVSSLG
jgi:hypothetical protein